MADVSRPPLLDSSQQNLPSHRANTHSDHRCQDVPWLERDIRQIQQSVCQYFMWVSGVPEPQPSALARHWYALGRYIWNGLGDREPSEPNPHSCGASDRLQATSSSSYHPASPILERGYTAFRGDFQPNVEEMTEAVRSIFAYKAAPVSKGVKLLALEAWEYLRTNPLLVDWSNYTDEEHASIAQEKSRLIAELEQIERDAGREELLSKVRTTSCWVLVEGSNKYLTGSGLSRQRLSEEVV